MSKPPETNDLSAHTAHPAEPADALIALRGDPELVRQLTALPEEDAEVQAQRERELKEREEWLVDLVSTAMYRHVYRKKGRGQHRITGGAFDLLHFAYVSAAREGAKRPSGVIITAGQGALDRAKGHLGIDATTETLTTYTAHWNYFFAGHEESGILSGPVETARGTYRVRFFMRGDKSLRLFWLNIEDEAGTPVLRTRPDALRVRLNESGDKLLARHVAESHTASREFLSLVRAYGRNFALIFIALLTLALANDDLRAAAFERLQRVKEKIASGIRALTGRPEPRPVSEIMPAQALQIESAPPEPLVAATPTPNTHEQPTDVVLPPGVWLDALRPKAPAAPANGVAPIINLNPRSVSAAYADIVERDPVTGSRRLIDREQAARVYPDVKNFSMNTVRSGAPASTLDTLSLNQHVTGPQWAMYKQRQTKWLIYRVTMGGDLIEPPIRASGRQVFVQLDRGDSYAVIMHVESEPYQSDHLYAEMGLGLLQFDRGKWKMEFPGSSVIYGDLYFGKPFRRQVVAGQRWNEPIPGRYVFLIFPGRFNTAERELFIDFGDGTTDDRAYKCGDIEPPKDSEADWSEHTYSCAVEHTFTTPGTRTVTVKLLDKRTGGHPNHPLVEEFSTKVDVTHGR